MLKEINNFLRQDNNTNNKMIPRSSNKENRYSENIDTFLLSQNKFNIAKQYQNKNTILMPNNNINNSSKQSSVRSH